MSLLRRHKFVVPTSEREPTAPEDEFDDDAGERRRRRLSFVSSVLKPFALLFLLLIIWQVVVDRGMVKSFLLASPTQVASYMANNTGELTSNSWATAQEVLLGFGFALLLAIVLGLLMSEFPVLEDSMFPLFVTFQVIPTVAIAPLLVLFLGFGLTAKVVTAMIVCIFPMVVNTVAGLRSLDADTESLARSLRAGRWKMLRYFRLPNALPYIFVGARTGITLAVIGAVIGEFVSADKGLGYLVQQASSVLATAQLYSGLVSLAFLGIILFSLVRIVEWWAMPWRRR